VTQGVGSESKPQHCKKKKKRKRKKEKHEAGALWWNTYLICGRASTGKKSKKDSR
jgi:hypothetical protein